MQCLSQLILVSSPPSGVPAFRAVERRPPGTGAVAERWEVLTCWHGAWRGAWTPRVSGGLAQARPLQPDSAAPPPSLRWPLSACPSELLAPEFGRAAPWPLVWLAPAQPRSVPQKCPRPLRPAQTTQGRARRSSPGTSGGASRCFRGGAVPRCAPGASLRGEIACLVCSRNPRDWGQQVGYPGHVALGRHSPGGREDGSPAGAGAGGAALCAPPLGVGSSRVEKGVSPISKGKN